jgi:hypothetical protein
MLISVVVAARPLVTCISPRVTPLLRSSRAANRNSHSHRATHGSMLISVVVSGAKASWPASGP